MHIDRIENMGIDPFGQVDDKHGMKRPLHFMYKFRVNKWLLSLSSTLLSGKKKSMYCGEKVLPCSKTSFTDGCYLLACCK